MILKIYKKFYRNLILTWYNEKYNNFMLCIENSPIKNWFKKKVWKYNQETHVTKIICQMYNFSVDAYLQVFTS